MSKFIRSYHLKAGDLEIKSAGQLTPLNIEFSCNATITSQTDSFTIKIWNLSPSSRSAIRNEYDKVELLAGYDEGGSVALIAKGELRTVYTERQGVDLITTITAGSGDKGCESGKCNKTFDKNVTIKDVLKETAKGMENVKIGEMKGCDIKSDKTHMTIAGNAKRVINKIAKRSGIDWFIELQELKALKKDERFSGTTSVSAENGMIGSPRESEKGVSVDVLLDPSVRIGSTLEIKSRDVNRSYKIVGYVHSGSYYGGQWKTTITGESKDQADKCGRS